MTCVMMHVLPEARGFELSLCTTLMTTRRVASAELSY
jgi:hypothetical protein